MNRLLRAALCWLVLALPVQAHPSHTSFAEIGWSETGAALEISLRVIPEDLENVLGLREGSPIALQDTAEHRAIIAAWLKDEFVVGSENQALPQHLVGLELAYDETWIYFTVTANKQQKLTLANAVLHGYNRERGQLQINQVQRLWAATGDRMTFTDTAPQQLWAPDP